jgi:DNA anti-recombination protein RmuC
MDSNKPIEVVFAPGCFDHFEGTQAELDQMIAEITEMVLNGTAQAESRLITAEDFDQLPEEVQLQLARVLLDPEDQHLIPERSRRLQ